MILITKNQSIFKEQGSKIKDHPFQFPNVHAALPQLHARKEVLAGRERHDILLQGEGVIFDLWSLILSFFNFLPMQSQL